MNISPEEAGVLAQVARYAADSGWADPEWPSVDWLRQLADKLDSEANEQAEIERAKAERWQQKIATEKFQVKDPYSDHYVTFERSLHPRKHADRDRA